MTNTTLKDLEQQRNNLTKQIEHFIEEQNKEERNRLMHIASKAFGPVKYLGSHYNHETGKLEYIRVESLDIHIQLPSYEPVALQHLVDTGSTLNSLKAAIHRTNVFRKIDVLNTEFSKKFNEMNLDGFISFQPTEELNVNIYYINRSKRYLRIPI